MAASYATDVGGGSHHDALLGLRDLPSFQDKYTVECVEARLSFFRLLRPDQTPAPDLSPTSTPDLDGPDLRFAGTCGSADVEVTCAARPRPWKARFAG